MKYLLFHCLDENAELNPDDDSDVAGSAADRAVDAWDSEMEARGVKLAGGRLRPVGDVNAVLEFDVLKHVLDDLVVEIVAAEMIVAVAREDLGHVAFHRHHGDVECSAAQIVDERGVP